MREAVVLAGHSLRRLRGLVLVMGALVAGFQVLLALAAATLYKTGTFNQLVAFVPPLVREVVGPSFFAVMSYTGVVTVGYFHFAVTAALVALAIGVGTEPAGEVERAFADLVLSRPVTRSAVVSRTALVLLVTSTFLVLMMLAGTWSGIWWIAPRDVARPAPRLILSLALNLWAVTLCWGGLAAAVAARSRRRIAAGSLTGLAALALYLLDYLARFWKPAESFSWLSPFHYYSGLELIVGRSLPLENILILLGTSAAGFGVAYVLFTRRDL